MIENHELAYVVTGTCFVKFPKRGIAEEILAEGRKF